MVEHYKRTLPKIHVTYLASAKKKVVKLGMKALLKNLQSPTLSPIISY